MKIFKIFIKTKKLGKTRKSFELLELELGSIITKSSSSFFELNSGSL